MSVVVVGGGLSGLFTAVALIQAGEDDVVVVERAEGPGGVAATLRREGFTLEPAVGSVLLPHPHLSPILDSIGVEMRPSPPQASARHVFAGGRLVAVPASPQALLAPVVSWPGRLRALLEVLTFTWQPSEDETVARFCRRHFGEEAGRLIAWLMASGVFAGDPDRLSMRAAFPQVAALVADHGSVLRGMTRRRRPGTHRPGMRYPAGGMSALAEHAVRFLGARCRGGFEVTAVRSEGAGWVVEGPEQLRARSVVVASRPEEAASLLDAELRRHLGLARAAPVAVVGLGGQGRGVLPGGFGALIGPGEGLATLGILFESSYAPERAPVDSWLIKVILGGATMPEIVDHERLAELAHTEAERVLTTRLDVSFVEVVRHHPGIPQYDVGHERWLAGLDALLADRPGLHLTGWAYRGVGVSHLATDARRVAGLLTPPRRAT